MKIVLMKKTIQPRLGKLLLMGEEYRLQDEYADTLVRRGHAEILPEVPDVDGE